jgi:hypothetical protein
VLLSRKEDEAAPPTTGSAGQRGTLAAIVAERGRHFDPDVVDALLALQRDGVELCPLPDGRAA